MKKLEIPSSKDEIIEEIRTIKYKIAEEHNFSVFEYGDINRNLGDIKKNCALYFTREKDAEAYRKAMLEDRAIHNMPAPFTVRDAKDDD